MEQLSLPSFPPVRPSSPPRFSPPSCRVASRRVASPCLGCASSYLVSSRLVSARLGSARLGSPRLASFLRLVEKSSVVNGNSGFIVPLQTMPGNIIKTFRRNILMLTHRFTVRQTFRSSKLLRLCVSVPVPRLPSSFSLPSRSSSSSTSVSSSLHSATRSISRL